VRGFLLPMRFLIFKQLAPEKGVPYSDRQLKRLEAKGAFPKRVALAAGGSIKGWPEIVIDQHLEALAEMSRAARE
jgi:predicted DNA-binding transcriptional regulator AlpA